MFLSFWGIFHSRSAVLFFLFTRCHFFPTPLSANCSAQPPNDSCLLMCDWISGDQNQVSLGICFPAEPGVSPLEDSTDCPCFPVCEVSAGVRRCSEGEQPVPVGSSCVSFSCAWTLFIAQGPMFLHIWFHITQSALLLIYAISLNFCMTDGSPCCW